MSGDVQPRKRKDKKRKKDDIAEEAVSHQHHSATPLGDDQNIHVHKERSTGGGICAKFVFFVLLGALAVIIGLIITEHRGLTDLEAAEAESRFSQLFAGWIDSDTHEHDENDALKDISEEEHDSVDQDEEEDALASEEEEDEAEEEDTQEESQEEVSKDDDDEEEEEEENASEDEEDTYEQQESDEARYDEESKEDDEEDEEPREDDEDEELKEEDDEDDEQDNGADEESEEKTIEKRDVADEEEEEENDDVQEEDDENPGVTNIAVKFGVGVSILVVAYVVLVRKWKSDKVHSVSVSDDAAEEVIPDLGRRNTIVPPPNLEEVEPDMENVEEDYSEEEEEEEEEESEDDTTPKQSAAKRKYQELQSTYSRSLTPDGERKPLPTDDYEYYGEEEEEEDDDEEELSEDDYENDDDEELLKRLEAKYGKLKHREEEGDYEEQQKSWKRGREVDEGEHKASSGVEAVYDYANITNEDDFSVRDELDAAQREINDNAAFALKMFDAILEKHPASPRALCGKAQSLDSIAERKRSNEILWKAIETYQQVLSLPKTPDALYQTAAERCINRMHFLGRYGQAIAVHKALIRRFPETPKYRNQLVVTYLTINKIPPAKELLQEILRKWPNDGLALVHYGFILKTVDYKLKEAVDVLKKGIATKDEGVIDGRFYFHLGDALMRLGRNEEAMETYEDGVKHKVFLSKYQRSLYNVNRLTGKPWWRKEETPYADFYEVLEKRWKEIRDEGLKVLNEKGYFQDESENLRDVGDWKQFELFARGVKNTKNCLRCPITCQIIESFPDAGRCKRGQTKFSVMHPGTHVWPHCGPTNCRLRVHLGLKVPPKTYIRVADEIRSWEEGKVFIFDDSFEHEVWHNGTEFRLVLIVDVWHFELTPVEKRSLAPI